MSSAADFSTLPPAPRPVPRPLPVRAPTTTATTDSAAATAVVVLDLVTRLLSATTADEAQQLAAHWIADCLGAEMVVVGAASPDTLPCRIAAVAGPAGVPQEREVDVEAALGEAIITTRWHYVAGRGAAAGGDRPLWPGAGCEGTTGSTASLAHRQLARALGDRLTLTGVPLLTMADRPVGALLVATLPHADDAAAGARRTALLQQCAAPLAEILANVGRTAPAGIANALARLRAKLNDRRGRLLLAGLAVLTVAAMIPVRYQVRAEVTLQARTRRTISAPLSAVLKRVHVVPGQSVQAGDLLLTLDEADTLTRLAALEADAHRAASQRAGHLAVGQLAEAELARFQTARLEGEIDLLRQHLQRTEVRSPIDGVVLCEELEPLIGAPLEIGQQLLEVAPPEQFTAHLRIPPDQICHVQTRQAVTLRLESAGALPATRIMRVHPRAQPGEQGRYVFTATAPVSDRHQQLKPGMQGVAMIATDHHPLIWCMVQRIWQRVRTWV